MSFDAYNIAGNNYFKLRDLAYVLNGTEKQFSVSWDAAANTVTLASGKPYTPVGGEMAGAGAGDKNARVISSGITLNDKEVTLAAFNIGGNNYFKLRDIGQAFDFGVDWDGERNTIAIDTGKGYASAERVEAPFISRGDDRLVLGMTRADAEKVLGNPSGERLESAWNIPVTVVEYGSSFAVYRGDDATLVFLFIQEKQDDWSLMGLIFSGMSGDVAVDVALSSYRYRMGGSISDNETSVSGFYAPGEGWFFPLGLLPSGTDDLLQDQGALLKEGGPRKDYINAGAVFVGSGDKKDFAYMYISVISLSDDVDEWDDWDDQEWLSEMLEERDL
jgi:hypothetical protein